MATIEKMMNVMRMACESATNFDDYMKIAATNEKVYSVQPFTKPSDCQQMRYLPSIAGSVDLPLKSVRADVQSVGGAQGGMSVPFCTHRIGTLAISVSR